MLDAFYRAVCPRGRRLVYTTARNGKRLDKQGRPKLEGLVDYAVEASDIEDVLASNQHLHGFISVQGAPDQRYTDTLEQVTRERDPGSTATAFFLDLDIADIEDAPKDRHQKYDSVEDMEASFTHALEQQYIAEPNYIVRSGSGGMHLWYILRDPVSIESWESMYQEIARELLNRGFKFDTAVGSKAHMLIRAPGSINKKKGVDKPVTIERRRARLYSGKDFRKSWGLALPGMAMQAIGYDMPDDRPSRAISGELESLGTYPVKAVSACRFVHQQLKNGTDSLNYDQYVALASVVRHLEHGSALLHKASRDFSRYNPATTDQKLDPKTGITGPVSCRVLVGAEGKLSHDRCFTNEMCARCPALVDAKKDKVYPVLRIAAQAELLSPRETTKNSNQAAVASGGPIIPEPYLATAHEKGETHWGLGKEVWNPRTKAMAIEPVTSPIFYIEAVQQREDGTEQFKLSTRQGRSAVAPPTALNDVRQLCDSLSLAGVAVADRNLALEYFQIVASQAEKIESSRQQLGWKGERLFASYEHEYAGHLSTPTVCDASQDHFLDTTAGTAGTLEGWRNAVDPAFGEGAELMLFTMAFALGSVLIKPCGLTSDVGILALYSPDSGTGKTTCLKLATSLFGQPVRSHMGYGDTPFEMRKRLGFLNNLPACIDELTTMTPDNLRDFVYAVVQGAGKRAGRADGGSRAVVDWSLGCLVSTNESIWQTMSMHKKAVIDRVMEHYLRSPILDKRAADGMLDALLDHHGTAGVRFVQQVQSLGFDKVRETLRTVQGKVRHQGYGNEDRFTTNAAALAVAALVLCKSIPEFRVEDSHIQGLFRWLSEQSLAAADKRAAVTSDAMPRPADLYSYISLNLRTRAGVPLHSQADDDPMKACWMDGGTIYVRPHTIQQWLVDSRCPVKWGPILSDWVHRGYCDQRTMRLRVEDQRKVKQRVQVYSIHRGLGLE